MLVFSELTEENLFLYAAKHYYSPTFTDADEFNDDLNRFKYIKRLVNRYLSGEELPDRLIMNHLIVVSNVFGIEAMLEILGLKLEKKHWAVIKPFLIFLKYIKNDQYTEIEMDKVVIQKIREVHGNR
jgi:hypothetical protein